MKIRILTFLLLSLFVSTGFSRDLKRGYRGFAGADVSYGKTDYWNDEKLAFDKDNLVFLGITTSHGYQFNHNLFLGAGCMISCATPTGDMTFPVFADIRYDSTFGNFTPFIDLRGGFYYDGGSEVDLYIVPTIGYSFRKSKKLSYNLGAGATFRGNKTIENRIENGQFIKKHIIDILFTVRFEIEFQQMQGKFNPRKRYLIQR